MKRFKIYKDTFHHDSIGAIVKIKEDGIDSIPKVSTSDGTTFYCPLDNMIDVTIEFYWKRFEITLAVLAGIFLILMMIGGAINDNGIGFFSVIALLIIGWAFLTTYLIKEQL